MSANSKSSWCGVYCDSGTSRSAVASYFVGMADNYELLDAQCLEDNLTGRTLKIKAIGRDESGKFREFIRTFGRNFTITERTPTARTLKERGLQS